MVFIEASSFSGQSAFTAENRFAGWTDVPLSQHGLLEADEAAKLIHNENIHFDIVHTSVLERTIATAQIVLKQCNQMDCPIARTWRLNERHYGQLEGKNKIETSLEFGKDQVRLWRRSWHIRPPPVSKEDIRWPGHRVADYPHSDLDTQFIVGVDPSPDPNDCPFGEAPADCMARVLPYFEGTVAPDLRQGKNTLIVAHGTPLRCVCKMLEGLSDDDMLNWEIPSGVPLVYSLNRTDLSMAWKKPLIEESEMLERMRLVVMQSDPESGQARQQSST